MKGIAIEMIKQFFAGIILFISVAILIIFIGSFYEDYSLEKEIDDIYSTKIYPEATDEINTVVQNISAIKKPDEKLHALSRWIQANFTSSYNNPSFKSDSVCNLIADYILTSGHTSGEQYYSDSAGHRVIRAGKYARNPLCIAFYRAGACGECAVLAQYVSNLSGLNTRIVGDPSGYHSWVEIEINGTWYFYDPTIPEVHPLSTWFGPQSENNQNSVIVDAACIFSENEDITYQYPPTGSLNICGIHPGDSLWLSWERNEKPYRLKLSSLNETLMIRIRPKTYTVDVSRLLIFSDTQQVTITEGNLSEIRLFT